MMALITLPKDLLTGIAALFASRELRACALAPIKWGILLFVLSLIGVFWWREDIANFIAQPSAGWLHVLISWSFVLCGIVLSGIAAVFGIAIGGVFYFDRLATRLLIRRGVVDAAADTSLVVETSRQLLFLFVRILLSIVWVLLFVVSLLFPVLTLIVTIFGVALLGLDVYSSPLAILRNHPSCRWPYSLWSVLYRHPIDTLAVGLLFSAALLIPLGGLLFVPVLYSFAVERLARWNLVTDSQHTA